MEARQLISILTLNRAEEKKLTDNGRSLDEPSTPLGKEDEAVNRPLVSRIDRA